MRQFLFLCMAFSINLFGCTNAQKSNTMKIQQGISGKVQLVTGNQMPMKNRNNEHDAPFACTVFIYPTTTFNDVIAAEGNGLYLQINNPLVQKIKTDANGNFSVFLEEGSYSVFVGYKNMYFANVSNAQQIINPVKITKNTVSPLTIKVDADAVY